MRVESLCNHCGVYSLLDDQHPAGFRTGCLATALSLRHFSNIEAVHI